MMQLDLHLDFHIHLQGWDVLYAELLEKTWKDTPEDMQIKATGNLRALFARSSFALKFNFLSHLIRLKDQNIKIAICTSDSREGTVEFLEKLGLDDMVDMVVCGDDKVTKLSPTSSAVVNFVPRSQNPSRTLTTPSSSAESWGPRAARRSWWETPRPTPSWARQQTWGSRWASSLGSEATPTSPTPISLYR